MTTKLTLTMDKKVINRAKKFAAANDTSLSHMVERYFQITTSDKKPGKLDIDKLDAPLTRSLVGSVKVPADFDPKKVKHEYLMKKYG